MVTGSKGCLFWVWGQLFLTWVSGYGCSAFGVHRVVAGFNAVYSIGLKVCFMILRVFASILSFGLVVGSDF